jgi:hypothetical protein
VRVRRAEHEPGGGKRPCALEAPHGWVTIVSGPPNAGPVTSSRPDPSLL